MPLIRTGHRLAVWLLIAVVAVLGAVGYTTTGLEFAVNGLLSFCSR